MNTCTVDDCAKPTRSTGGTLCKMHYHRWYRHGDTSIAIGKSPTPTVSHGRRYKTRYDPTHPLAMKSGNVYLHRAVLYDAIGPGRHACYWCGCSVQWAPKGTPDILVPDHLNGIGDDNRIENLVPSCMRCNSLRASQAKSQALRAAGWWSAHDTIDRLKAYHRAEPVEQTMPPTDLLNTQN